MDLFEFSEQMPTENTEICNAINEVKADEERY